MKTYTAIKPLQKKIQELKTSGKTIGFVPTMGALHKGHASLLKKARRENDILVLSIFVNPKQFGPKEDFKKYPREEKKDKMLAEKEKVDIIFYPSDRSMYPKGYLTYVQVDQMSQLLCGSSRPGHFQGVTTVVTKLLNIVTPDNLYLGQKDAQQALILKRMIEDLNFQVKVHICPTVREKDGLAVSSRNSYLRPKQKAEASILYQSLKLAQSSVKDGTKNPDKIIEMVRENIQNNSSGRIDYVSCVNADSLKSFRNKISGNILIALAVYFGKTRLIDNIKFRLK